MSFVWNMSYGCSRLLASFIEAALVRPTTLYIKRLSDFSSPVLATFQLPSDIVDQKGPVASDPLIILLFSLAETRLGSVDQILTMVSS